MGIRCWRNPLLLLIALVLSAKLGHFQRWEGFQEKPMSKKNMNSTLNFFIQSYNNASNDTYLYRVQKLTRSQMQVCTLLFPDISRPRSCPFRHVRILGWLPKQPSRGSP